MQTNSNQSVLGGTSIEFGTTRKLRILGIVPNSGVVGVVTIDVFNPLNLWRKS